MWGIESVAVRLCVCVCLLGMGWSVRVVSVRNAGITQVQHVCLLCGTEINLCPCGKWHDNRSPPHHHLPPRYQFVAEHPTVAVPSFNSQEKFDGRKGKREKTKKPRATISTIL